MKNVNSRLILILLFLLPGLICPLASARADLRNDLDSVIAYPNPVRTAIGQNKVTFENLTMNVRIRIFKINGDMIKEINATDTTGQVIWDLTNDTGQQVGSAVYLYLITNADNQKMKGKIAIIR